MKILTVKDALKFLGISRAKLYYYEEVGKIPAARRTSTGQRFYLPEDLEQVKKKLEGLCLA